MDDSDLVLFYFSAKWCPPCRRFTPLLKQFVEHDDVKDTDMTVIFSSSDNSEEEMTSYFIHDHGDYFAIPFDDKPFLQLMDRICDVDAIPKLCVVNKNGVLVHDSARIDVLDMQYPRDAIMKWLRKLQE